MQSFPCYTRPIAAKLACIAFYACLKLASCWLVGTSFTFNCHAAFTLYVMLHVTLYYLGRLVTFQFSV